MEYTGPNQDLEAIYTPDGRIIYEQWDDPSTPEEDLEWRYRYEFTQTDHLGNARVSFSDFDGNGFIPAEARGISKINTKLVMVWLHLSI